MSNKFKAFQLTIKALSQPTLADANIYFESAFKALKPSPIVSPNPIQAYALDKHEQVQRVLVDKTPGKRLNLKVLTEQNCNTQ